MIQVGVVDQKLQADLFTLFALSQEQPFVSQDAQVDFKNKKKEENKKKANNKDAKEDEHQEKTTKQAARKDKIGAADSDDKVCDADLDDGEEMSQECSEDEKKDEGKARKNIKGKKRVSDSSKGGKTAEGKGKAKSKAKAKATTTPTIVKEDAVANGEEAASSKDSESGVATEDGKEDAVAKGEKAVSSKDCESGAATEVVSPGSGVAKGKAKAKAKAQASAGSDVAGNEEEMPQSKKGRKWDYGIQIPTFMTCQVVVYGSRNEVGLKLKDACIGEDGKKQAKPILFVS